MKTTFAIGLALLLAVAATGCSSSRSSVSSYSSQAAMAAPAAKAEAGVYDTAALYEDDAVEEPEVAEPATGGGSVMGGDGGVQPISLESRKIVTTMNLTLQTTDFEGGVAQIPAIVEGIGGYIQDSYVEGSDLYNKYYSRSANFTVRVPSDKLDAFGSTVGGVFHIVNQQKSSNDITDNYYDTQARLDTLKIQEERLLAMLEGAGELEYLIQVEKELADVRYQIESMTTAINRMNSSVDLSTVTMYIQEVVEYSEGQAQPATFSQRVSYAFADSWDGFVNFCQGSLLVLIALLPFLIILAIIAAIVLLIVRRYRKRHPSPAKQQGIPYSTVHTMPPQDETPPTGNNPTPPAE